MYYRIYTDLNKQCTQLAFFINLQRAVSYPDGPITARYRFIKNAYWDRQRSDSEQGV